MVVGATGSFGALVVAAALVDRYKVKAVARDRAHAALALPTEAEVVEGDVTRAAVH
ncbi:NAD(P)H-binding protein [Streptomyces lavendulae]|uniref:NAD(P)H-binding protein n=1 Tax=Streptomyces lavendulae TaxID=1914 RepID=UPI00382ECC07